MDFKALLDISDFIIYQLNFFENGIIMPFLRIKQQQMLEMLRLITCLI